jgi:hypothetical protein
MQQNSAECSCALDELLCSFYRGIRRGIEEKISFRLRALLPQCTSNYHGQSDHRDNWLGMGKRSGKAFLVFYAALALELSASITTNTRMRSNCIEICNKLLRSLSSYEDLFQMSCRACGKIHKKLSELLLKI